MAIVLRGFAAPFAFGFIVVQQQGRFKGEK